MRQYIILITTFCVFKAIAEPNREWRSINGHRSSPILDASVANLEWNYQDQSKWSKKYPICSGSRQSPINLNQRIAKTVEYKYPLGATFYTDLPFYLTLVNNGHTVDASSTFKSRRIPCIHGGPLNGTYTQNGMHWHWGEDYTNGAEHTINGKSLPLEMHIVHYKSKFRSIEAAAASAESDAFAVLGIRFKEISGPSNFGIYLLIDAMKKARSSGRQSTFLPLGYFGLDFKGAYYSYLGSLTTPPCWEYVRWVVMETPLNINHKEANVLRSILVNGKPLINNYRKLQPLNNRKVTYSNKRV